MKIKIKLTFMGIAMMAVVAVAITAVLLIRASQVSVELSIQGMQYLNRQQSEYWDGRINSHIRALRTLANVMAGYEGLAPETRRDVFDEMLKDVIEAEQVFFSLNTTWRPNAIDGMDAQMIGRIGSTPTGQYAVAFTRETNRDIVTIRSTASVGDIMTHINGPNARRDLIEDPFHREVWGSNTYMIRMAVPIINSRNNEIVGVVSCMLDLVMVQPTVERVLRDNPDIAAMSIYANNGFIVASYIPENIGRMLGEVNTMFGDEIQRVRDTVRRGEPYSLKGFSPALGAKMEIDLSPFTIGNSNTTWTIMLAKSEPTIMAPVRAMTNYAIIIAVMIILVGSAIAFLSTTL